MRIGSPEKFASVREFFRRSAFDDATVCRALAISEMSEFGGVRCDENRLEACSPALRWCIEIFTRGLAADEKKCLTVCGEEAFASFVALGLLRPAKKDPTALVCPVWIYPADGFVVASDRREDPDGDPYSPPEDVVFPAIYPGTLRFLRLLPEARDGQALDLCGGSGIGALRFSRTAREAVTTDLTERSAFFAEFNARLNDTCVSSLCGDLYAPVLGRQFDIISAHPPFVPATGQTMAYRDGGETGEEVTRRTVEGLPAHLAPGGTCVIVCLARDTQEQTFEQRAREWLGVAGDEFDLVFGLEKILSVEEVVEAMRKRGQQMGEDEMRQLLTRLRSLGTRQFVYGALFFRRYPERVAQPPLRIRITPDAGAKDFERLLAWRHFCRQPGFSAWLSKAKPRFAAHLELTARHLVRDGELVPAEFVFSIEGALHAALRPDGWVVPLLGRLEGKRSVEDVFETARKSDELPEGFTLDAFAGLVCTMIERGFLEVDFPR